MEKTTIRGASLSVLLTNCYSGDHMTKNEIGGSYGAYGEKERRIQGLDGAI